MVEGTWTAHFLTPGGEVVSTTYRVMQFGGELLAELEFAGQRFGLTDYQLNGDTLSFTLNTGFEMDCRLARQPSRQYKGSCLDEMGNVGPAVIGPPGVEAEAKDLDLDEAFDVWGMSREEYERARMPRPTERQPRPIAEPEAFPGRMVDLGGYRLNAIDLGEGDVTVVLESSVGDDHKVWSGVLDAVAERTRVLAYDRAGLGMSDSTSAPRTPDAMAGELRKLLDAVGAQPPYVLVGHEYGALTVRSFLTRHPDDVAGLVLIDPSHEREEAMWAELDAVSRDEYLKRKRTLLSALSRPASREFGAYEDALRNSGGLDEGNAPRDVPVIVMTGLRPSEKPRWVGESPEGLKAKENLHRTLAAEFGGEFLPVSESGSYVQIESPDRVVEAISRILDGVEE